MKRGIIILLMGLIAGIAIGLTIQNAINVKVDFDKEYGVLETSYYIVSPIATLITLLAVIVAIFGNDIRRWFLREKCQVSIENDSFTEILNECDDVRGTIEARRYDCMLCVENIGGREIEECRIFLKSISYWTDNNHSPKRLRVLNPKSIYWNQPGLIKTNIMTKEKKFLPLFCIYPFVTSQTPDNNQSSIIPTHLSISGYSLDDRYNRKGIWEIQYSIATANKVIKEFSVKVFWSGEWKQRQTEMIDEVTVELKNK